MEELLINNLLKASEKGSTYRIERDLDSIGTCVYNLVCIPDNPEDSEEILFSYQPLIPDLSDGLCLCNDGDVVGFGTPNLEMIDGTEISGVFTNKLIGNSDGFLVDWDNDGVCDDVIIPLRDLTGDGVSDWGLIVDNDNNGIPDVSTDSPFYPIGSEDFQEIVVSKFTADYTIMNKPLSKYSVTEGILIIGFIVAAFGFFRKAFRRKRVVNNGL